MNALKILVKGWGKVLPFYLLTLLPLFTSCSETEDEEAEEFSNWENRNTLFFASLEDSLAHDKAHWRKIKSYSKDPEKESSNTEYVYVKVIETGEGTESPLYNDSIRVSYQGRLLPSRTYTEGYVFDGTVYGSYDKNTNASVKFLLSSMIEGWTSALLYMHRGDRWRIYIPWQMGYGTSGNSSGSIPGYSVLIFDLTLIDFCHIGETMPAWSSRQLGSATW